MLHHLAALDSRAERQRQQRRSRSPRAGKGLRVQSLEPRTMLAGDVAAEVIDNTLFVTGDSESNAVHIDTVQRTREDSVGVSGGVTSVSLDAAILQAVRLQATGVADTTDAAAGFDFGFPITPTTDFEFSTTDGFAPLDGTIEHDGTVTLGILEADGDQLTGTEVTVGNFTIGFDPDRVGTTTSGFFVADNGDLDLVLFDVGIPGSLELDDSSLSIGDADLLVSADFAAFLTDAGLAGFDATGVDAGDAQIDAELADIALRRVDDGKTSVGLNTDLLASVGLTVSSLNGTARPAGDEFQVAFEILRQSDFVFDQGEGFAPVEGRIEHKGTVGFNGDSLIVGNFSIGFDADRAGKEYDDGVEVTSGFFVEDTKSLGIPLFDVAAPGSLATGDEQLQIADANLLVSSELASTLDQDIEGVVVGTAQIDAQTTPLKDEFIRVAGRGLGGRTTINGERAVEFAAAGIENLVIETGAGRDRVRIHDLTLAGDLSVDLGDGRRNVATLRGVHVDGLMTLLGGDGRDSFRLLRTGAGALNLDSGSGADMVFLKWSSITSDARVDLGDGRDFLLAIGSRVGGTADFDGGRGPDRFFSIFSRYGDLEADGFRSRPWWWF